MIFQDTLRPAWPLWLARLFDRPAARQITAGEYETQAMRHGFEGHQHEQHGRIEHALVSYNAAAACMSAASRAHHRDGNPKEADRCARYAVTYSDLVARHYGLGELA